ncbi:hypothetical protein Q5P01_000965 [Channa striata]|uniref:Uncharacterized protein n=1 Tax=Channa striata TaxID=64152 RepID=A0AA88LIM1_CHASR|nr:hypothetical protein Q5P01_000965 [Channa striata]
MVAETGGPSTRRNAILAAVKMADRRLMVLVKPVYQTPVISGVEAEYVEWRTWWLHYRSHDALGEHKQEVVIKNEEVKEQKVEMMKETGRTCSFLCAIILRPFTS